MAGEGWEACSGTQTQREVHGGGPKGAAEGRGDRGSEKLARQLGCGRCLEGCTGEDLGTAVKDFSEDGDAGEE